jgi:putative hemolysin
MVPLTSDIVGVDAIALEVGRLPVECLLLERGRFQVFCAEAAQIPHTLREIGRLRAISFHAVGEGSGSAIDLDRYDRRYLHLFSWDQEARRVVGAYRLGPTDRIVAESGVAGLYTRSLFDYDERLLKQIASPALELGRSFVRAEYQKHYNALSILWNGIGQFIAREPRYRHLFGPVSISRRYSDASRRVLTAFLRQHHGAAGFDGLVTPLHPPYNDGMIFEPARVPASVQDVNALVERADGDGKGMPVLLRQYLKLNARVIALNVDPAFAETLDALMIVDLAAVESSVLRKYLGGHAINAVPVSHAAEREARAA